MPTRRAVSSTSNRPTAAARSDELLTLKVRYKEPTQAESKLLTFPVRDATAASPSESLRFSAAVAAFGMLLRDSKQGGNATYEMADSLARGARGQDPHGYRSEFLQLLATASDL